MPISSFRKALLTACGTLLVGLPIGAFAGSTDYAALGQMVSGSGDAQACQQAQQSAEQACQATFQRETQNLQKNVTQPSSLSSGSCLGGLLSTSTGMYSQLESLANGGGLSGFLQSIASSLEKQFTTDVCSAISSKWDQVSGQIDGLANLPQTLGQAVYGYAQQGVQQAADAATAPINNVPVPGGVAPILPSGVPQSPLPPPSSTNGGSSSGSGNGSSTSGGNGSGGMFGTLKNLL